MLYEKIQLDEKDESAYLSVYVADKVGDFVRNALLVIPGGGYGEVCSEREGEPIGMAFMPYGYNAFVLHYSVKNTTFPNHLIQASKAIKHIRDNAEKYNINPDKVFTVGFSAGGHLAGCLGMMWDKEEIYKEINMPLGYNKPNGVMLIYPVISYHEGSFKNLLGINEFNDELLKKVQLHRYVSENSSPIFMVHTANDKTVNVKNSLDLAYACADKNIPFELHVYPDAPHGLALGNHITAVGNPEYIKPAAAKWVEQAVMWAEKS